jgi:hypothetical protein
LPTEADAETLAARWRVEHLVRLIVESKRVVQRRSSESLRRYEVQKRPITYKTLEQSPQNVDSERTEISVPRTELCTLGEWCEYGIVHVYGLTPQNVDSERTEEGARVERDLCVAGHVSPPSGVVTNRL